jgi:hypothetical protein
MKVSTLSKNDIALHGVPTCALCNKPVSRFESSYNINTSGKLFRAYCHGQMEEVLLNDEMIENTDSIRMGQAFIDKLPQPQLEAK